MLRLADIYLIYAEAILGNNASTTDPEALLYVNKVRERAKIDPLTSLTVDALIKERRIELACEGQYWSDMVRLSYYNSPKAIQLLGNGGGSSAAAKRVSFEYNNDTGVAKPKDPNSAILEPTIGSFTFPIPAAEVTANPLLLDAPVSYY